MSSGVDVWVNFAHAIVKQAAEDLEKAIKKENRAEIEEIEVFFKSGYFVDLCDIEGNYIVDMVYKKVRHT